MDVNLIASRPMMSHTNLPIPICVHCGRQFQSSPAGKSCNPYQACMICNSSSTHKRGRKSSHQDDSILSQSSQVPEGPLAHHCATSISELKKLYTMSCSAVTSWASFHRHTIQVEYDRFPRKSMETYHTALWDFETLPPSSKDRAKAFKPSFAPMRRCRAQECLHYTLKRLWDA